ncbi:CHAT domain-containing protein [bacterium]|nr:CHAT domain-containing protein [bacterium]
MYLKELSKDTFIILHSDWTVGQTRDLIERFQPTHVISILADLNAYYLHTLSEARHHLSQSQEAATIHQAFSLREDNTTPLMDAYSDSSTVSGRAIVKDEGEIIGVFEPSRPKTRGATHGMVTRGGSPRRPREASGPRLPTRNDEGEPPSPSNNDQDGEPVTHTLITDFHEQMALNQTASLLVSIAKGSVTDSGNLPFTATPGETVDIVVQPKRGFVLENNADGQLTITDEEETLPLQFKLKATQLGPGKIRVLAFRNGQPLGDVNLVCTVVAGEESAGTGLTERHTQPMSRVSVNMPDLSMWIFEHRNGGLPSFTIRMASADGKLNMTPFGPVDLRMNPSDYFNDLFQDIKNLSLQKREDRELARHRLNGIGNSLFERVIPDDLKILLWSLRDQIKTIQVQSEDPWIPWELCKLSTKENGRIVEGPFLCEGFEITRWLMGTEKQAKLTMKNVGVVVPRDTGLPDAEKERTALLEMATRDRKISSVSAKYVDLLQALASGAYDGWHFTGHSGYNDPDPDQATIKLENEQRMIPMDLSGEIANLGVSRPFVFFNSCKSIRMDSSLTGIGGWAVKFLRIGAAGFMGSYWSVRDRAAFEFCEAFYNGLFSGMPVGKATKEARNRINKSGDPTWLAYTVYADPMATVQTESEQ